MKKLYIYILALFVLMSCDPDDPNFESVDIASIGDDLYTDLSGPATPFASGSDLVPYTYVANYRANSTYEWSVNGMSATITQDPSRPFRAEIIFEESSSDVDATVVVTETTEWGATVTTEMDVVAKAFCALDLSQFVGTYTETFDTYTSQVEVTLDPDDPLFGLVITNFGFSDDVYWCGDTGAVAKIKLNACDNSISFPGNAGDRYYLDGVETICDYVGPSVVDLGAGSFDPSNQSMSLSFTVRVDAGSFGDFTYTYVKN